MRDQHRKSCVHLMVYVITSKHRS